MLLKDPRVKEEATPTLVTMVGYPTYVTGSGQWHPDIPMMGMTPSLLADGKFRVAFIPSGSTCKLSQPFELDLERDRWYAILLDVRRSPDGTSPREHLCCTRVELRDEPPAAG